LEKIVNETAKNGGVILIPAFAVGRAQTLMYMLWSLQKDGRIPKIPMYLNSPLAENATDIFCHYENLHKLNVQDCAEIRKAFQYVKTVDDSKALNGKKGPMIIISASGMATGGRILHHLKTFAPDPKNAIVLVGFQAAGTRGRAMQDGVKEIRIHGQTVPIRAQIRVVENLSAHADYSEILDWLSKSNIHPKNIFITHGEKEAALALKERIVEKLNWHCEIPAQDQEFRLE
jgi:metallo-beta-lactamase family protein